MHTLVLRCVPLCTSSNMARLKTILGFTYVREAQPFHRNLEVPHRSRPAWTSWYYCCARYPPAAIIFGSFLVGRLPTLLSFLILADLACLPALCSSARGHNHTSGARLCFWSGADSWPWRPSRLHTQSILPFQPLIQFIAKEEVTGALSMLQALGM
jgi:hypothetical protein